MGGEGRGHQFQLHPHAQVLCAEHQALITRMHKCGQVTSMGHAYHQGLKKPLECSWRSAGAQVRSPAHPPRNITAAAACPSSGRCPGKQPPAPAPGAPPYLVHGVVGVHGAVHAQHAERLLVLDGEDAQAHEGGGHRQAGLDGKLAQLIACVQAAATVVDDLPSSTAARGSEARPKVRVKPYLSVCSRLSCCKTCIHTCTSP